MKTANEIMKKAGRISAIIMFGAFLLIMTGCQKEEITPTNSNSASLEKPSPIQTINYTMIVIDHMAMRTLMPEYSVTVFDNGKVTFIGRRNTHITGEKSFEVSKGTIIELRTLYINSKLFIRRNFNCYVNEAVFQSGNTEVAPPYDVVIPDLPFTLTIFRSDRDRGWITLKDDNHYPANLVNLRKDTEKVLGIDKFVKGK